MQRQKPFIEKFHANNLLTVPKIVMSFAITLALTLVPMQLLCAQTYSVIHNFTGGNDGAQPVAGLTIDGAGNLYGTTLMGGSGFGVIYELKLRNGSYTANPLYLFPGGADGANPYDRVVFGPDGVLYGTAYAGGNDNNGVVFKLQPRPSACATVSCSWRETVLFAFPANGSGGTGPNLGDVVFDAAGDMYGTTLVGGADGDGVVWELTPPGTWGTEIVLDSFTNAGGNSEGHYPDDGVILDSSGNLFGATSRGGASNDGLVYELVKASNFRETVLYDFAGGGNGSFPDGGLVFDASGNLYGTTAGAGSGGGGTVFELSPPGVWNVISTLYSFSGGGSCAREPGPGSQASLTIDGAGSLYGTTCADGAHRFGNVFKLSPSGDGWSYTDLYDFAGGSDGSYPYSKPICDASGNLYGTAYAGGTDGNGVAWKISGAGCLLTESLYRP